MPQDAPIRFGAIFWLDDIPALDGGSSKRRPVLVISQTRDNANEVDVVGISASMLDIHQDRVRLPDTSAQPQCTTGLTEPSWTCVRWHLVLRSDRFSEPQTGYLGGKMLRDIADATLNA